MTDEQIVEAAKSAEKKTEFGELVHSQVSRGVNSAYGIGFLEGAEWAREQMMKEAVEGAVVQDLKGVKRVKSFSKIPEGLHFGDKVRVIVIPNTDEK